MRTGEPLTAEPTTSTAVPYTLRQFLAYMLGLGTWGFGGPVALVGYMYRELVEQRRWISESDYKEGMTIAQLMPGPPAGLFAAGAVDLPRLGQIGAYFAYAGSFVFGSGLAIVPFLYGGVVKPVLDTSRS